MFGISWVKLVAGFAAVVAVIGVIYAGYSFVDGLVEKNAELAKSVATLEEAKKVQDATIKAIKENAEKMAEDVKASNILVGKLQTSQADNATTINELKGKYEHVEITRDATGEFSAKTNRMLGGYDAINVLLKRPRKADGVNGRGGPAEGGKVQPAPPRRPGNS